MATTVKTGLTDTSEGSAWTACTSYQGVRGAACITPDGMVMIVGGKSVAAGPVETTNNLLTTFRLTGSSVLPSGLTQYAYEWRRETATAIGHIEDCQAVALTDAVHRNYALACGGHTALGAVTDTATILRHFPDADWWSINATGAMGAARAMHRASVLSDDTVLVSGGFTAWDTAVNTCEIWDPATEAWAATGAMAQARMDHGQVVLADGRVLVAGGRLSSTVTLCMCEVFDPATGLWAGTGQMTHRRYGHALVLLPDGSVLAIGGIGGNQTSDATEAALATAELWSPNTGIWIPAGRTTVALDRPAAIYQPSTKRVIAVGGVGTVTQIYDTVKGRWRRGLAGLAEARDGGQAVLLPIDDLILLAGGSDTAGITTERSHILVTGAEDVQAGGANGTFAATIVNPTRLSYQSGVLAYGSGPVTTLATVTPSSPHVRAATDAPGPFVQDPTGVPLTGIQATVAVALPAGRSHPVLTLDDSIVPSPALAFPADGGWLYFRFGYEEPVGPVRYFARLSNTELELDASFVFPATVEVADPVVLLSGRTCAPITATDGVCYVTASTSARVACSAMADDVVAAGIPTYREVVYPGDRGLGNEGRPTSGEAKISDVVSVFAGDQIDTEVDAAREAL